MNCPFCHQNKVSKYFYPDNILCDRLIYEDAISYAVLSTEPYTTGHTFVILKRHKEDITDSGEFEFREFSNAVRKVAKKLKDRVKNHSRQGPDKIYVSTLADGIQHLHAHLIPRYPFTDLDRAFYRRSFFPRDGFVKVEKKIKKGRLGGFWYMALRERDWKNSEFAEKPAKKRALILEDLARTLRW